MRLRVVVSLPSIEVKGRNCMNGEYYGVGFVFGVGGLGMSAMHTTGNWVGVLTKVPGSGK